MSPFFPSRQSAPVTPPKRQTTVHLLVRGRREATPWENWCRRLALVGLWLGISSLVGGLVWTSLALVIRPRPPQWIVRLFPYFDQGWGNRPQQTWADIQAELAAVKRRPGELITLTNPNGTVVEELRLLPIWEQRSPCSSHCDQLVELRLYGVQRQPNYNASLQLLDQLTIQGPSEAQIIDPIWHPSGGSLSSTYRLPLQDITALQTQELPGFWFNLTGRWQAQSSPILYGQIIHVDVQLLRLQSLLTWYSPSRQLPIWQDLDGVGLPELVVNQSWGLEPRFMAYRVTQTTAAAASTRLEAIALTPLDTPSAIPAQTYQDALFLAQNGLWSAAYSHLLPLKQQATGAWSPALEQQLQIISFHAQLSHSQAQRDWSRSHQKLLALLLDGQWAIALERATQPDVDWKTVVLPLLAQNSPRIWQRLTATLQVQSGNAEARLWGALVLLAREDEASAKRWLAQAYNARLNQEFAAIAAQINPPKPNAADLAQTATQAAPTSANSPTERSRDRAEPTSSDRPEAASIDPTPAAPSSDAPARPQDPLPPDDATTETETEIAPATAPIID